MQKTKGKFPKRFRPEVCGYYQCERPRIGPRCIWCEGHLEEELTRSRKLLRSWGVTSRKQDLILIRHVATAVERQAGRLDEDEEVMPK